MADFIYFDKGEQIFILNNIELLATIFHGPDAEKWLAIFDAGLPQLRAQAPQGSGHITDSLAGLQESRPSSSEILEDQLLETEYVRLFVTAGGGVPAPLYESCHLGDAPRTMGESALAMRTRLAEAGLEISFDSNEPADHLCIELEYLYHLLATAWAESRPELEASACVFAGTVMLHWVRRFRDAVTGARPPLPLAAAADHLVVVLEHLSKN